ncbi:Vitamin B12 ABC transporter, substrate-binding protein BtuF [hydrothermal vent metagenome]|uniref:Vitamin B12 ABC transporter, substrate-binding protein BtuF n=1 Tax=hydrothermal vent metagenome TaxID=652676 RepID=A0A3B0USK4_9ZZZZ
MKRLLVLLTLFFVLFLAACGSSEEPTGTATSASSGQAVPEQAATDEPIAEAVEPTEEAEEAVPPTAEPVVEAPTYNLIRGCVENYDESFDYFPQKAAVTHADGFTIEYFNNYKIVTVTTPWTGAEEAATYLLVQCGTPAPSGFGDAIQIEVPISSFVSMSTTYLPYIEMFGRMNSLVGVDSAAFAYSATVRGKLDADELVELGSGPTVDVEAALELAPDVIMTFASGSSDFDTHPKLEEVGLTVVLNADYLDITPLGRAEWGKFIATFYNDEALAEAWFDSVTTEYDALAALTADVAERPTVFANTPFDGTWYMPGGQSYTAQFLNAAGADYLWGDDESTSTLFLDFESVFDQAADAAYWLNLGFVFSQEDLEATDERFADFAAFQSGSLYNYDLRTNEFGGNDFFESAAANPQVVLADLIKIFHPDLVPDHAFVYYRIVE